MQTIKRIFFLLMVAQGMFWLILATTPLVVSMVTGAVVSVLMLLNGLFFIALSFFGYRSRWLSMLTFAFLAVNLVLSVTDQMGVYDIIVLVMNILSIAACMAIVRTKVRAGRVGV